MANNKLSILTIRMAQISFTFKVTKSFKSLQLSKKILYFLKMDPTRTFFFCVFEIAVSSEAVQRYYSALNNIYSHDAM